MDKSLFFEILEAFERSHKLSGLRLETSGMKIELFSDAKAMKLYNTAAVADNETVAETTAFVSETNRESEMFEVKSPIVGTYYQRPSPDSAPYITVGQNVKKGDVLCIVEAMKMMNEIECEIDGIVAEILVNSGDMVEFDQVIIRIEEK